MKPIRSDALAAPVQPFTFHDTTLEVARDNGDLWISIRRVCEALGLDDSTQRKKLRGKAWATEVLITSVAADGRAREQAYLHLDALPMWLATIEPSRVSPEARPRLERFQVECARALRDHFFGAPHAPAPTPSASPPRSRATLGVDETPWSEWTPEMVTEAITHRERRTWRSLDLTARAAMSAFLNDPGSQRWRMWAGLTRVLVDVEHEIRSNRDLPSVAAELERISDDLCGRAAARQHRRAHPSPPLQRDPDESNACHGNLLIHETLPPPVQHHVANALACYAVVHCRPA